MHITFHGKTQDYEVFILIRIPVRFFYAEFSESKLSGIISRLEQLGNFFKGRNCSTGY